MKHAYLILAHNEFEILQLLVSRLDDCRNDIYVHFDKKVTVVPKLRVGRSRLFILDDRLDVRWGGFSMIEAEYALFSAATSNGPYAYYHLLSGVDLPLKNQEYIHRFFSLHEGEEFIGFTWTKMPDDFRRKVLCRHLFAEDFRGRNIIKRALRAGFLYLQETLGLYRNKDVDFKKGSQWVSITDGMASYFLDHKDWVRKVFRSTFCCDELVMQTLCWKSPFRQNLHSLDSDSDGNMRAIGWRKRPGSKECVLVDWSAQDWDVLENSPALFARKFNSIDPAFIEKVVSLSQ